MAKYDVYRLPGGKGYVLDVQTDFLSELATRVVVPLLPSASVSLPAKRLNPVFQINGEAYVMLTQSLAAIPAKELKQPVSRLLEASDEISHALDMLFQGF